MEKKGIGTYLSDKFNLRTLNQGGDNGVLAFCTFSLYIFFSFTFKITFPFC